MRAARRIGAKNAPKLLPRARHTPDARRDASQTLRFSSLSYLDVSGSSSNTTIRKRAPPPSRAPLAVAPLLDRSTSRQKSSLSTNTTTTTNDSVAERSSSNNGLMDYKAAQELTKVLDVPDFQKLGTFSDRTWRQISNLVKSWTQFHTAESVESSFAILERLLTEQEWLLQNISHNESDEGGSSVVQRFMPEQERRELQLLSRNLLNTELLNEIVKSWRKSWKANETALSPLAMLSRMEQFIDRSPSLHPDTKTYNMIMDAATKRFQRSLSFKVAEDIVQRMTNNYPSGSESLSSRFDTTPTLNGKLRCRNDISPDEYTYTTLINVYANAGKPKAAEAILNRLHKDYIAGKSDIQPTVRTFTACITAWAKSKTPNAPEQAERLVELMHALDQDGSLENVKPNVFTYNCLIDCWAKSGRDDAGEHAEEILRTMEASKNIRPDRVSYNSVLHVWTNISQNVERAEAVLRRMYTNYRAGNYTAKPDLDSYRFILEGLQRIADTDDDAPRRANMYLKRTRNSGLKPDLRTYNCALACWAKSKAENAGGAAEGILREMKAPPGEHARFAPVLVKPNSLSYTSVINAYAKNGQAKQAEMIFRSMYREYNQGNTAVKPKLRNLNAVLGAWDKSTSVSDDERVKAMLKLMQELPHSGPLGIKPDIVSANILLNCLAKSSLEEGRNYAEKVLFSIEAEYKATQDDSVRPDKYTYTSVMKAHANVGDLYKTKETLKRMMEQYANGNEAAKPDIFPFNNILLAIARGSRGRNENAGVMANEVFKEMRGHRASGMLEDLPNRASYTLKMNCWAASGDSRAGEEADKILEEMEKLAANGQPEMEPDAITISNAINAHAKCGNHTRAEALLKRMLDDYSSGNRKMKPTLQTINMVLASLARANTTEAAEQAEVYLHEMLAFQESESSFDLKPDAVTFTTVISAWANSGDPGAAECAKALFRRAEMFSQSPDHQLVLDAGFYKSVLRACALSGDMVIAESLLQEIVEGDEFRNIQPDRYMYHPLLQAYSKSDSKDAAKKAEALLIQMSTLAEATENSSLKPDYACYRYVLKCWANKPDNLILAADRSEALLHEMEKKADEGEESLKPDPSTYSMVINTMARAGDTERTKWILKRMYDAKVAVEVFVP